MEIQTMKHPALLLALAAAILLGGLALILQAKPDPALEALELRVQALETWTEGLAEAASSVDLELSEPQAATATGGSQTAAQLGVDVQAPNARIEPEPYRITWRGSTRYLYVDGAWHVWSSSSKWVRLPEGWTPDSRGER